MISIHIIRSTFWSQGNNLKWTDSIYPVGILLLPIWCCRKPLLVHSAQSCRIGLVFVFIRVPFLPEIFHISMGEWEKSIFHSAQKNDKLMLATTHSFLKKKVCMKEYPDRIAKIYAGRAAGRWLRQRSPLVRIYWEWFDLWSCRCWDLGFFETHRRTQAFLVRPIPGSVCNLKLCWHICSHD